MDILMLGSGGREHALIKKLKESPKAGKIYCAPGNGGISKDAECVNISVMDKESIRKFCCNGCTSWAYMLKRRCCWKSCCCFKL